MHAGRKYSLSEVALWTRRETFTFLMIATVPTLLYAVAGWKWMSIPWLPIALVGTAVAFITGFKNNASYDRLWEARKIWGAIVNSSREWAVMVTGFLPGDDQAEARQQLIYRHIAWLAALRYQLRAAKKWENQDQVYNEEFRRTHFWVPETCQTLDAELALHLSPEETEEVLSHSNRATKLIGLQSDTLQALRSSGALSDYERVGMHKVLGDFFTHQGKAERIKNFPYPRQFATLNLYFVWLFVLLVPFGMLHEFDTLGEGTVWFTIPGTVIVAWVFHTMDKIGEASENPFEGSANDIPMTSLSRTIEIDLRELLGEKEIPAPIGPNNDILM